MKKRLLMLLLILLLSACTGQAVPGAVPAPSPDLFMSSQYTQATVDAIQAESRYLGAQLTATAEAPIVHITETAAAYEIESGQTAQAGTATAGSAQGTATAEALSAQATTTAAQTATAASWTATAVQNAAIIEAASQAAQQTAIANQTERDNLLLDRQRSQNRFYAALPIILIVLLVWALALAFYVLLRRLSYRTVARDARGDAQHLLNVIDGVMIDPDRSFFAQLGTRRSDLVQLPPVTAHDQRPVTERDQLVDLATRGLPGSSNAPADARRRRAADQLNDGPAAARFEVLGDGALPPAELLNPETLKVIEAEWKEETHDESN